MQVIIANGKRNGLYVFKLAFITIFVSLIISEGFAYFFGFMLAGVAPSWKCRIQFCSVVLVGRMERRRNFFGGYRVDSSRI